MSNGWDESASAWIADMADVGDSSRQFILDAPMLEAVRAGRFARALDVGCGEGRFCRMLQAEGIATVGIDPTPALLEQARARDPSGDYRPARAEALPFDDASFDLVVSYLTLIDIDDYVAAIAEMARVLQSGGRLLIANLNSFNTAGTGEGLGWTTLPGGRQVYVIDGYLEARAEWVAWRDIRIRNWHRPLGAYMAQLLDQGLILRRFAEPEPYGGDPAYAARYRRAPYFMLMEWEKP